MKISIKIASILIIPFFLLAPYNVQAQTSPRSVDEIVEIYDSATSWEQLNELISSLTDEEIEILFDSEYYWIAEKSPDPEYIESVVESGGEIENYGIYEDDYSNQANQDTNDVETEEPTEQPQDQQEEKINDYDEDRFYQLREELNSCFDYYSFGSVEAKLFTSVDEIVSGVPLTFSLELTNNNQYPIVEGDVYVRVYRQQDEESSRPVNGDEIVEEFLVVENFSLEANEQREYEFTWNIPALSKSGKYYATTYVVSSDRYNLLGLTFTDDIAGDKVYFDISGTDNSVYFNKNNVSINDQQHQFISYPPQFGNEEEIRIDIELVNETSEEKRIEVVWDLYAWDSSLDQNKIDSRSRGYLVPANSSRIVSYNSYHNDYPVYLMKPQLISDGVKSILNIRYIRDGINMPRVNFPGVDAYPLVSGEEVNLFSCLHNTSYQDVDGSRYVIRVEDLSGNTIHEYTYNGIVTSDMMGVQDVFTPNRNFENFKIVSELYLDGELIDQDELVYQCSNINPGICPDEEDNSFNYMAISIIVGLILLIIFVSVYDNKKKPKDKIKI